MEKSPLEKKKEVSPKNCPDSFSLYTDKCFDCLAKNPFIVCPDKTQEDVRKMFPDCWKFPEKLQKKGEES